MRARLVLLPLCLAALCAACGTQPAVLPEIPDAPVTSVSEAVSSTPEEVPSPEQMRLDSMTLEEKVGQLFLARCPEENAAEKAAEYHLGGYILFGRDFEDKSADEVRESIQSYQAASAIPMFIAVDEEGGAVNRVSRNPALRAEPFRSPQALYAAGGLDLIRSDTEEKCALLSGLGINLNFAPVCDLSQEPADFIYSRALGQDADTTADYVKTVVSAMAGTGVGGVLKHFPGYGNNADTHTGVAVDERPLAQFETEDFVPFRAGINAGAGMVLVSHNIVTCMDGENPASLSPEVHRVLREEMGFDGVIVTDDLSMTGACARAGDEDSAALALQAGNDLLCCTEFETQIPAVLDAVRQGTISEEQIDAAVLRVLRLKSSLGLLALSS